MKGIVVGVDGSASAAGALEWAAREGSLRGLTVTAVMAWGFLDQHHTAAGASFDPAYGATEAARTLDSYVDAAVGPAGRAVVEREVVCDLAAPALLGAAEGADLLVVGERGLGGFRGLLLGSVSEQCLHHAACPVAIVRDPRPAKGDDMERIVVGIDGSETAHRALQWAVEEAKLRNAALEVVHAWHLPYVGGYPYTAVAFDPMAFEEPARATLDAAVDSIDTGGLAHPVERILRTGGAAAVILDVAKGAGLVVVGSRGLGGFTGMLLGSVSHHIAHHATCPVVVVPPEA